LYISNFTFVLFNDSEYVTRCNSSYTLKTDVSKFLASYALMDKNTKTETYDKTVASGSVNVCQLKRGMGINFLALAMLELASEFTNFKAGCPMRKGDYYMRNAPLSDTRHIPSFLPGASKQRTLFATFKAKPVKSKFFIELVKVELYGTIDADAA